MAYQRTGNLQSAVQQLLAISGGITPNPTRTVISSGTSTASPYTYQNTTTYYQKVYFYGTTNLGNNCYLYASPDGVTYTTIGFAPALTVSAPFNYVVIVAPGEYARCDGFGDTINYVVLPL